MAMHVVRVQREEPVDRRVDLASQSVLDPLADHRALLARHGEEVGLGVGIELLAERHVQVLLRPVRTAPRERLRNSRWATPSDRARSSAASINARSASASAVAGPP